MAVDKKFFVDINLQGNALKDAVIGSNSKMGTAGSFRFDGTRLEYFDGSSVQSVANLDDISAVTGGLILQGGYDAATNTPDIADTNASKGYFWVVTAAGSFLGESVQVGDSIIAKVDEAGASIGDWLILQGNVVIATDSIDGIVRLATQGEVYDGTEGGAVVVTPATLQGKIDTQITPTIDSKLPLSGGTMSGNINMGTLDIDNVGTINVSSVAGTGASAVYLTYGADANNNKIINVSAPTDGTDAANKTYVDDQAAAAQAAAKNYSDVLAATKLNLSGGTMSGSIDMGGNDIGNVNDTATASLSGIAGAAISLQNNIDGNGVSNLVNIPAPTNGGDAANMQYVDDQAAAAQAAAEATASADATAKADAAQAAAESYATTAASNAQSNAESFASNAAATAQLNAQTYADGLAVNYDPAGAAATAQSNAEAFATIAASTAQSNAETFATNAANTAQSNAETFATNAANTAQSNAESFATGAANQALADANTYTNTQITAQTTVKFVDTTAWVLSGDFYYAEVLHTLGSYVNFTTTMNAGQVVEFAATMGSDNIVLFSNTVPSSPVLVLLSKVNNNG